jgi:hypothetical protein
MNRAQTITNLEISSIGAIGRIVGVLGGERSPKHTRAVMVRLVLFGWRGYQRRITIKA